jgi:hypothetical protein
MFGVECLRQRLQQAQGTFAMNRLVVGFVIFAMFGWFQERPALPVPRLDKGSIEGKTYRNASIGLELTPDPKLKFGAPELKGKTGTVSSSLMVAAWGKFRSGSAREGTAFWAVPLAFYPADQRSTDACMRRVVEANQKDGLKPVQSSPDNELGGALFARTDFLREGPAYETVFVKTCDTLVLGFVFTGSDREAVNKLIAATDLKLDLPTAGCGPKSANAAQR